MRHAAKLSVRSGVRAGAFTAGGMVSEGQGYGLVSEGQGYGLVSEGQGYGLRRG
ncbi:MAG: hypothetical protein U0325_29275 [Polyangiales bacterium]